jgi:hypothetical protein
VEFLDTAGQHEFALYRDSQLERANAFLVVYAIDDARSFEEAKKIVAKYSGQGKCIRVVGNKSVRAIGRQLQLPTVSPSCSTLSVREMDSLAVTQWGKMRCSVLAAPCELVRHHTLVGYFPTTSCVALPPHSRKKDLESSRAVPFTTAKAHFDSLSVGLGECSAKAVRLVHWFEGLAAVVSLPSSLSPSLSPSLPPSLSPSLPLSLSIYLSISLYLSISIVLSFIPSFSLRLSKSLNLPAPSTHVQGDAVTANVEELVRDALRTIDFRDHRRQSCVIA